MYYAGSRYNGNNKRRHDLCPTVRALTELPGIRKLQGFCGENSSKFPFADKPEFTRSPRLELLLHEGQSRDPHALPVEFMNDEGVFMTPICSKRERLGLPFRQARSRCVEGYFEGNPKEEVFGEGQLLEGNPREPLLGK